MLNRTITLARPYAEQLQSKNLSAAPIQNTVLQDLVSHSQPMGVVYQQEGSPWDQFAEHLSATISNDGEVPSDWGNRVDGYIRDISAHVAQHISYARNVVMPQVMALAQAVQQYKETAPSANALSSFEIKEYSVPEPLKDDSFLSMFEVYKERRPLRPEGNGIRFVGKTPEELRTLISTGHSRSDELIDRWLMEEEGDFLSRVWGYFSIESATARPFALTDLETGNAILRAGRALAFFLIASKLVEMPELQTESSEQVSLSRYRELMKQFVDYSGALVAGSISQIASSIRTGVIVLNNDRIGRKVTVFKDTYRDWMNEGGSVEALLGMAVSSNPVYTRVLLDEGVEKYKAQWASFSTLYQVHAEKEDALRLRDFIHSEFINQLQNREEIEEDYINKHNDFINEVSKCSEKVLEEKTADDLKDHYSVALCLVAGIRFSYTPAYEILSDIGKVQELNPNVDVREAALLAVINYVADYMACQIVLR